MNGEETLRETLVRSRCRDQYVDLRTVALSANKFGEKSRVEARSVANHEDKLVSRYFASKLSTSREIQAL